MINDRPSTELPEGRYQNHVGETFEFVREGDSSLGSGPSSVTYTVDRDADWLVVGRKKSQYASSERGMCVWLPNEMKMLFPRKGGAADVITFRKVGVPDG